MYNLSSSILLCNMTNIAHASKLGKKEELEGCFSGTAACCDQVYLGGRASGTGLILALLQKCCLCANSCVLIEFEWKPLALHDAFAWS